jgi:hypothetical protein
MKSPLAATTFSSLDMKGLQALLVASMGIAEDLHDGGDQGLLFCVRGSVNTSPRYATL